MEDREFIELIAKGYKTRADIRKYLEPYSKIERQDFCRKIYGRIPMGDIAISETYDGEGHEVILSGLTPQQMSESDNLTNAIGFIESHFGFDTLYYEAEVPEAKSSDEQPQHNNDVSYSYELIRLFKSDTTILNKFVEDCKCHTPSYIAGEYKKLRDKVISPCERGTKKTLHNELVKIGLINIKYHTFKSYL